MCERDSFHEFSLPQFRFLCTVSSLSLSLSRALLSTYPVFLRLDA